MAASGWTCPGLLRAWLLGTTALLPAAGALAQGVAPNALPAGGQVAAGSAAITQSGTTMQVRQTTDRAAINWQSFNIGSNASVKFQQPAATSWTLNRVTGPDPSVIAGRMTANGGIAVVNQSGVVFAQGAQVNVGSLIASAANITNENFMAGRMVFDGAPKPGATVENHGSITVADRGLAALVGPRVGNTGTIRARLGRVALQGAETYSLDLAGDGLLSIDVTQAVRSAGNGTTALVTNSGVIEAKGGSVLISAHAASGLVEDLVRNTGRINADTAAGRRGQVALRAEGGGVRVEGAVQATGRGARQRGGTIEAVATGNVTIARGAVLDASGGAGGGRIAVGVDASSAPGSPSRRSLRTAIEQGATLRANATARGNGGQVLVNSEGQTTMRGAIEARGGAQSGDGGLIEISGKGGFDVAGTVDLSAQAGRRGALLLDPERIVVDSADNIAAPAGDGDTNLLTGGVTPITAAGSSGTLYIAAPVITTLLGAADLTLQADRSITFNAGAGSISNAGTAFSHGLSLTVTAATALATDGIFLNNTDIKAASLNLSSRNGTAAAGTISIGAALTATGDVTIASENVLIGGAVAGNNVTVTAGDTVSNAGVILAHRDLGVTAGGSIRNGQGLLGGAADSAGAWMLAETGRLVVAATAGDVQNLGQMVSTAGTGSAVLAATVLDMSRGGVILLGDARREAAGAGQVAAASVVVGSAGRIVAGSLTARTGGIGTAGQVAVSTAEAATGLDNSGTLVALASVRAGAGLGNSGTLATPSVVASSFTNTGTFITGIVTAATLTNVGTLSAAAVTVAGDLTNSPGGSILAGSVSSTAGSVLNSGTIHSNTLTAGLDVRNLVAAARINATTVTATAGHVVNAGGARIVNGTVQVAPPGFELATLPGPLTAAAARALALAGTPLALGVSPTGGATASAAPGVPTTTGDMPSLTITAGDTVSNAGAILAHRDLGVTAGGSIRNGQGLLGGVADSAGAWMLAETGRLVVTATAGDVQNLGQMVSTAGTGSAVLAATVLDMSRGGVILLGDARREAAGAGEVAAASVVVGSAGRIVAGSLTARTGGIGTAGQVAVSTAEAATGLDNSGTLVALASVRAGAGAGLGNSGTLITANLEAPVLTNSGTLSAATVTVAGDLTNSPGGSILAGSVSSTAGSVLNSGTIHSNTLAAGLDVRNLVAAARINATTVTATAGHVVNAGGARIVNGTVQVAPTGFELATLPGPLTAATAGALALVVSPAGGATASAAPGVPTTTGDMPSLTITAGDTVSNAGVILAHRDLGVTAGGSIRNGQGLLGGAADSAGAWMLAETGRLVVTATAGDVQNLGQMVSTAGTGSAVRAATVLDMSRGGVILLGDARREAAGAGEVAAASVVVGSAGRIVAGSLTARTGGIGTAGQVAVSTAEAATGLDNSGTLVALASVRAGAGLGNSGTLITASLEAPVLTNSGTLSAATVTVAGDLTNSPGASILAGGVSSTAGSVLNSGTIHSNTLAAGLDVRNLVAAARINATTVSATAGHVVNASGARIVNGTVQVAPPGFELATLPGPLTAAAARALALAGTPLALGVSPTGGATASAAPGVPTTTGSTPSLTITAGDTVSNAGVILAHRDLGVTAGGSIRNGQGLLGGAADSAGAWMLAETGRLVVAATAGDVQNLGQMVSTAGTGSAVLAATVLDMSRGGVILLGDARREAAGAGQVAAASVVVGSAGRIVAGSLAARTGGIGTAGQVAVSTAEAATGLDNSGTLVALASVRAGAGLGNSGTLITANLEAPVLTNSGTLSAATVTVAGDLTNSPGGSILAGSVSSTAGSVLNSGTIHSNTLAAGLDVRNLVAAARINATTVTATAGHVVNAGGARIVNGTVQVAPTGFELATLPGPLTAATAGALALVVSPAGGATASAAPGVPTTTGSTPSLTVTAGDTVSNAGVILAHRDLGVTAGRSIRNTAGASLLAETGRLTITATAGAIDMTSSSAGAGEAVAFRAGGAVTVTTAAIDAAVDQSILSGGSFTVTGSSLTAGRDLSVDVGGELRLESTALQASRDLSAVTRLGGISLADSTLTAGGTLGLTASGAIGQTRGMINAAAGTAIQAGSGITITGAGGAAPVLRSTGGGITLTADSGDIALSNAGLSAASALAVQAIQGDVTIGSSSLSSDGSGSIAAGGAVNLASTIVRAMADQSIMAGGGFAAAGSSLAAGRDLTIGAGTGFGLTSSGLKAGRNLSITTRLGNAATTDGAFLAGGTLAVTAAGGAVTQTRGSITGAGDASLRGGTDVTVTDAGSGIQPALRSTGGALTVVAGSGAVSLRNARLDGATGLGLAAGQGIGLTDTALTTTGRLAAAAGSGSLAVLRGVLTSTAGDIDLTAGGTGAITASALHAPSASGSVRVVTTGGLALSTLTVSADAADFEAGRIAPTDARTYGATNGASALTVTDGVTASIGSKILFAGPVGVSGIGPILVTPRGTPLPAVLFDTRIAPGSNPLSIVQPDTAGVIASQQPTQVRSAPGAQSPGAFGLPNQSIAAGTANINVNAGQSPVFLLVDGGTVLGTITAGRLAIHGTGGGMTLFGTLNGSVGAEAARFADITRPIEANSLQRYRINACVVSSINCVVPPSIQIIPPRPSDRAQFSVENNRITADVLIPNVAEEIEQ